MAEKEELIEATLVQRPVESRHVFGIRCHVLAVDQGAATFEIDHTKQCFTIPLFGPRSERIGLTAGMEVWLEVKKIVPIESGQPTN